MTGAGFPASHYPGHDTEHEAAASIAPKADELRRCVLAVLAMRAGLGLTDDEGGAWLREVSALPAASARSTRGSR